MNSIRLRKLEPLMDELQVTARAILIMEEEKMDHVTNNLRYRLRSMIYEVFARFGPERLRTLRDFLISADPSLADMYWLVSFQQGELELWR